MNFGSRSTGVGAFYRWFPAELEEISTKHLQDTTSTATFAVSFYPVIQEKSPPWVDEMKVDGSDLLKRTTQETKVIEAAKKAGQGTLTLVLNWGVEAAGRAFHYRNCV